MNDEDISFIKESLKDFPLLSSLIGDLDGKDDFLLLELQLLFATLETQRKQLRFINVMRSHSVIGSHDGNHKTSKPIFSYIPEESPDYELARSFIENRVKDKWHD